MDVARLMYHVQAYLSTQGVNVADSIPNMLETRAMTENEGPDELAKRLRFLRERAGWTQQELADRAGIAQTAISKMEKGPNVAPRLSTLRKLAAAFGVPVADLTGQAEIVPAVLSPPGAVLRGASQNVIALPRNVLEAMLAAWACMSVVEPETSPGTQDFLAVATMAMGRQGLEKIDEASLVGVMTGWLREVRNLRQEGKPTTLDDMLVSMLQRASNLEADELRAENLNRLSAATPSRDAPAEEPAPAKPPPAPARKSQREILAPHLPPTKSK